jgi:hypothetical protein
MSQANKLLPEKEELMTPQAVRAFVQLRQMLASNTELWIKQLAIRLSCMSSAAKSLVIAQTGRARKEIRHQVQSGFRCHPRFDDPAGNEEKTPHRLRAVEEKMMTPH